MNKTREFPLPRTIECPGNFKAEIQSQYLWKVPETTYCNGKLHFITIDWTLFPEIPRPQLAKLGLLALEKKHPRVIIIAYPALLWLYRYLGEIKNEHRFFATLTETEWGGFAEWLRMQSSPQTGKPLSFATRRSYFSMLKSLIRLALDYKLPDVYPDALEALEGAMQRRFRDANLLSAKRSSERALSEEEASNLYCILREEWFAWKDWRDGNGLVQYPDILAVAAGWLAWDEGLRPEEINALTVDDINLDSNEALLRPPNKAPSKIKCHEITIDILKAVLEWGNVARELLQTNHLFVDRFPKPTVIGSAQLNHRLRNLIVKYRSKYLINREDIILADGRKTLGASLAAISPNRDRVRRILRHARDDTMHVFYIHHGKVQLSIAVSQALRQYAARLSIAYNSAVVDPSVEVPGFSRPTNEFENRYGVCSSGLNTHVDCSKPHCGGCPSLIPMVSKRDNWVAERDFFLELAAETNEPEVIERRLNHVAMCQAYVDLIDARVYRRQVDYMYNIELTRELAWDAFINQSEPYPGAGFIYNNDAWDLSYRMTTAVKPSGNILRYHNLLEWLKPSVKAYVSWGWLAREFSNSWCIRQIVALNHLSRYISRYHPEIVQLAQLGQSAAQGFSRYMRDEVSNTNSIAVVSVVGHFARWVRKQYGLAMEFRPDLSLLKQKSKQQNHSDNLERLIPYEVQDQLAAAVGKRHQELWDKWMNRPPSRRPKGSELLYLQVVKFLLATPLRISQILLMPREPKRESRSGEAPGVWVRFFESKTHQGEKEVFVPEDLADKVREAMAVATELTAILAAKSGFDWLFLTDSKGGAQGNAAIRNVSSEAFRTWLNGRTDEDGNVIRPGFIHRSNIMYCGQYYPIDIHQTRHTIGTEVYNGGAGFGTASDHLSHRSKKMTGTYVHGLKRHISEVRQMFGKRLRDDGFLIKEKEVFSGVISDDDLSNHKANGFYIQLTRYGFCVRPISKKPCAVGMPGRVGPSDDRHYQASAGLSDEDTDILQRQIAIWEKDEKPSPYMAHVYATLLSDELSKQRFSLDSQGNAEVEESIFLKPQAKKRKPKRHNGPLPQPKKESVIDGLTTSERVYSIYKSMVASGIRITITELARQARISDSTLYRSYPDICEKVRKNYISRLNTPKKVLIETRLQEEWDKAELACKVLTLSELARRVGLNRNSLYYINSFQHWVERVQKKLQGVWDSKKSQKKIAPSPEERHRSTEARLSKVWDDVQKTGETISLDEYAKRAGTSFVSLVNNFPHWKQLIENWNAQCRLIKRETWRSKLNETFLLEWQKIEFYGEKVSVIDFAKRCGVDRNTLYDYFPEWIEKLKDSRIGAGY